MRGEDVGNDAHALQELLQGRGEIPLRGTADPAHIPIHRQHGGQPVGAQEVHDGIEGGFGMEIIVDLGREQPRGASIDNITYLDEMLPLRRRSSGIHRGRAGRVGIQRGIAGATLF